MNNYLKERAEQIREFLNIPLEQRLILIDEIYEVVTGAMNDNAKKAFEYLRNREYTNKNGHDPYSK